MKFSENFVNDDEENVKEEKTFLCQGRNKTVANV